MFEKVGCLHLEDDMEIEGVRPMVIQYGSLESKELRDGSYKIVPRWEREKAD
jgi:hypothetical protein